MLDPLAFGGEELNEFRCAGPAVTAERVACGGESVW
jgi:hypothetical protein